jgi:hypothetical protein
LAIQRSFLAASNRPKILPCALAGAFGSKNREGPKHHKITGNLPRVPPEERNFHCPAKSANDAKPSAFLDPF